MAHQNQQIEQINFDAEVSNSAQIRESLQVAFSGLGQVVAEHRLNRAAKTVEKMEHKTALYKGLGEVALHTSEPENLEHRPQTLTERFRDSRLDKKSHKAAVANVYAYRAKVTFGPENTQYGVAPKTRRQEKRNIIRARKNGELLAVEARVAKLKVDAKPLQLGKGSHDLATKNSKHANKVLMRAVKQPLSSRVRSFRRNRAEARAEKLDSQILHLESKKQILKNKRLDRKNLQKYYRDVEHNLVHFGPYN